MFSETVTIADVITQAMTLAEGYSLIIGLVVIMGVLSRVLRIAKRTGA